MEKARQRGEMPTRQARETNARTPDTRRTVPNKEAAKTRPKRRAGDVEQAWQRAKLDPAVWPLPGPIHGRAGLTWAVLPTGEKVKWSDLGLDRRLDERIKYWQREAKKSR
jgi:hypothetical protein